MHFHLDVWEGACYRHRFIATCVVDDNDEIDNVMRHDFVVSLAQGARGVIGRHYYHDFLAVQHDCVRLLLVAIVSEPRLQRSTRSSPGPAFNLGLYSTALKRQSR